MPTNRHGKVRRMIKEGKATIISKNPFTIQLHYSTSNEIQVIDIGIDLGYKHTGFAIIANETVLEKGEMELRQDISSLITLRRTFRKSRRQRKTRYRKTRFLNRKRKDGWLPPSTLSKYNNILTFIEKLTQYLPHYHLHVEIAHFDIAKINQPDIEGTGYQQGDMYGYENQKQYLLAREHATCQFCKKKKDDAWHVHHIIPKANGGTNAAHNLALLHKRCHEYIHANDKLDFVKKPKQYKDATFMNIIKDKMVQDLKKVYPNVTFTYGYITSIDRKGMNLPKTHYNDAIAITKQVIKKDIVQPLMIKQMRKKKRSLHEANVRKGRKTPNVLATRNAKNTKQIMVDTKTYHLCDKVKVNKTIGFITGFTGNAVYVQTIKGEYIKLDGKTYKQITTKKITIIKHANNWISKRSENVE